MKVFVHPDGSVARLPKLPASALRGIVAGWWRAATIDEMHEAVADAGLDVAPRGGTRRLGGPQ